MIEKPADTLPKTTNRNVIPNKAKDLSARHKCGYAERCFALLRMTQVFTNMLY